MKWVQSILSNSRFLFYVISKKGKLNPCTKSRGTTDSIFLSIFFCLSLSGCGEDMEVISAYLESTGESPLSSEAEDTDGPEMKLIAPDDLSGEAVFQLQLADLNGIRFIRKIKAIKANS